VNLGLNRINLSNLDLSKVVVNVGEREKKIRIAAGAVLTYLAYTDTLGGWATFVGVVLIITAFLRFCPAYLLLDKNTCEQK
jgi:hypothetical protein